MRRVAAVLPLALLFVGCSHVAAPPTRHVVLVSGRDDHGLVASPEVQLTARPGGGAYVGGLADGVLAEVRQVKGTQVQVTAQGRTGWLDEVHLRGELRLSGPSPTCRVPFAGRSWPAGTRVEVLALHGRTARVRVLPTVGLPAGARAGTVGDVPVSSVVELPPAAGRTCPDLRSGRTDG